MTKIKYIDNIIITIIFGGEKMKVIVKPAFKYEQGFCQGCRTNACQCKGAPTKVI